MHVALFSIVHYSQESSRRFDWDSAAVNTLIPPDMPDFRGPIPKYGEALIQPAGRASAIQFQEKRNPLLSHHMWQFARARLAYMGVCEYPYSLRKPVHLGAAAHIRALTRSSYVPYLWQSHAPPSFAKHQTMV